MTEQINVPLEILPESAAAIRKILAEDAEKRKPKHIPTVGDIYRLKNTESYYMVVQAFKKYSLQNIRTGGTWSDATDKAETVFEHNCGYEFEFIGHCRSVLKVTV